MGMVMTHTMHPKPPKAQSDLAAQRPTGSGNNHLNNTCLLGCFNYCTAIYVK